MVIKKIVIYTKDRCIYCKMAKNILEKKKLSYEEINISNVPEKIEEIKKKSNGRRSMPQIFIDNQHIGGYNDLFQYDLKGKLCD